MGNLDAGDLSANSAPTLLNRISWMPRLELRTDTKRSDPLCSPAKRSHDMSTLIQIAPKYNSHLLREWNSHYDLVINNNSPAMRHRFLIDVKTV